MKWWYSKHLSLCARTLITLVCVKYECSKSAPLEISNSKSNTSTSTDSHHVEYAKLVSKIIRGLARNIPIHFTCLHRSVALSRILAHDNIPSEILIGAQKNTSDHFLAHAWVRVGTFEENWGFSQEELALFSHESGRSVSQ